MVREGMEAINDGENTKVMRETAQEVGLTNILKAAVKSKQGSQIKELLAQALLLLGVPEERRKP